MNCSQLAPVRGPDALFSLYVSTEINSFFFFHLKKFRLHSCPIQDASWLLCPLTCFLTDLVRACTNLSKLWGVPRGNTFHLRGAPLYLKYLKERGTPQVECGMPFWVLLLKFCHLEVECTYIWNQIHNLKQMLYFPPYHQSSRRLYSIFKLWRTDK